MKGKQFEVCGIVLDSGRCKVESFLKTVFESNKDAKKRVIALFQYITERGIDDLDKSKCEIVRGDIIELKSKSDGIRLFGFWDHTRRHILVLERGWKKGPKKEQDIQINEVIEFRKKYQNSQWPMEQDRAPTWAGHTQGRR